jgi:ABC-type glutathione transport system ATPase component
LLGEIESAPLEAASFRRGPALSLIAQGADVIAGKLNAAEAGLVQAAKEKNIYATGAASIIPNRAGPGRPNRSTESVMSSLLEMRGMVRCFGAVRANDGVDLDVKAGEILGLLGENGSGKSTLMKVLFGMMAPDSGTIVFRGRLGRRLHASHSARRRPSNCGCKASAFPSTPMSSRWRLT